MSCALLARLDGSRVSAAVSRFVIGDTSSAFTCKRGHSTWVDDFEGVDMVDESILCIVAAHTSDTSCNIAPQILSARSRVVFASYCADSSDNPSWPELGEGSRGHITATPVIGITGGLSVGRGDLHFQVGLHRAAFRSNRVNTVAYRTPVHVARRRGSSLQGRCMCTCRCPLSRSVPTS